MSHWKKRHVYIGDVFAVLKGIIDVLFIMLCFYLANLDEVYFSMGQTEKPIMIVFIAFHDVLFVPLDGILSYVGKVISRNMEYAADAYAKQLGHRDGQIKCLIRLQLDNKSYPFEDSLFFKWHSTHPTLFERIRALNTE